MIDPLGHLGVFQLVVDHPRPPLADRLHLRRSRRAYVALPRLRPQPVRLRYPRRPHDVGVVVAIVAQITVGMDRRIARHPAPTAPISREHTNPVTPPPGPQP